MQKVIVIDGGVFCHKAILAWEAQMKLKSEGKLKSDFIPDPDYTYMLMILSCLKKIELTRDDMIIIAQDGRNSWRKAFYTIYKENRKKFRKQQQFVDWGKEYERINNINERLHESTDWQFIKLDLAFNFADLCNTEEGKKFNIDKHNIDYDTFFGIEADDIQAYAVEYFSDKEVICVTIDGDLAQLAYYDNFKFFSPNIKFRNGSGCYKIIENPLKVLSDKIRLGDKKDNILKSDTDSQEHVELRNLLINLLKLPNFLKREIKEVFDNIQPKTIDYNLLPFKNSIGTEANFDKIYKNDKVITYEDAVKRHIRAEKKKKNKTKEKREQKKLEKEKSFR